MSLKRNLCDTTNLISRSKLGVWFLFSEIKNAIKPVHFEKQVNSKERMESEKKVCESGVRRFVQPNISSLAIMVM